jgi:hypothetical protein
VLGWLCGSIWGTGSCTRIGLNNEINRPGACVSSNRTETTGIREKPCHSPSPAQRPRCFTRHVRRRPRPGPCRAPQPIVLPADAEHGQTRGADGGCWRAAAGDAGRPNARLAAAAADAADTADATDTADAADAADAANTATASEHADDGGHATAASARAAGSSKHADNAGPAGHAIAADTAYAEPPNAEHAAGFRPPAPHDDAGAASAAAAVYARDTDATADHALHVSAPTACHFRRAACGTSGAAAVASTSATTATTTAAAARANSGRGFAAPTSSTYARSSAWTAGRLDVS